MRFNLMENLGNKILNINKKILITLALILMLIFISVMYFTEEYTNPYMHRGVKIEGIGSVVDVILFCL